MRLLLIGSYKIKKGEYALATLKVGTASAKPGSVATGAIPVTNHPGGSSIEIPVVIINGANDGPVLWIDNGIHGDEPQGAWAIHALSKKLKPAELDGAIVGIPFINVPAFESRTRGNLRDPFAYDMNRIYPGNTTGRLTHRIAWAHREALVESADMEISVHSGGTECFLEKTLFTSDLSLELAKAMGPGWELFLDKLRPTGSPMAELFELDKPAISIEQGGGALHAKDTLNDIDVLVRAFLNVLRHYKMIAGTPEYATEWRRGSQIAVLAECSGLWLPEDGIELHKPVKKGTVVGRVVDLHGNVLEEIKTPDDGEIFGYRTLPVVHTGEWMLFFGVTRETIKG